MRATAPTTRSDRSQPGRPAINPDSDACAALFRAGREARSGISAMIGMTAMSWKSSTAKEASPPAVFMSPRSVSDCKTIAVEDIARISPTANADCQDKPNQDATKPITTAVPTTCNPPSPRIGRRICHKRAGLNSRPTTKSIITTPNSAKCITSAALPATFSA